MSDYTSFYAEMPECHPERTAVVFLDLQQASLARWLPNAHEQILKNNAALLKVARRIGLCVIHVQVAFRSGYPEIDPKNRLFGWLADEGMFLAGQPGTDFHPAMTPLKDEPVVIKHRVGAFSGTDLDRLLRARSIDTLLLAGVLTSGAVLSAVRQAFDLDYQLVVARDSCADVDPALHDLLMERIIPHHAHVVDTDRFVRNLELVLGTLSET